MMKQIARTRCSIDVLNSDSGEEGPRQCNTEGGRGGSRQRGRSVFREGARRRRRRRRRLGEGRSCGGVARPSAPRPRRRPGAGAIGRVMRLWSQCRSRPHSPPHSPPQPPPGQKDDGEGMEWGEGRGEEDPSSVGVGRCAGEGRRCRAADPKAAEPRPSRRPASRPAAPPQWRRARFRCGPSGSASRSSTAAALGRSRKALL